MRHIDKITTKVKLMNFKKNILSLCAITLLSVTSSSFAVDYRELATTPQGKNDAVRLDAQGNIFVSNSGQFGSDGMLSGSLVYKISPEGDVSEAVTELSGPLGSDFDSQGNHYIGNFNTGVITKVTPEGEKSTFATLGYSSASGIVINSKDELFVASYGKNAVYKITPDGETELWIEGNGIFYPVGIALDEEENLYIGNYENPTILKVDSAKNVTVLGTTPDGYGNAYITYAGGSVYATGIESNKIYKVSSNGGTVEELEGSGTAGFEFPNGITSNADGTKLYVSNWMNDKIIVIENLSNIEPIAPTATNDSAEVEQDSEVVIDVLANDSAGDAEINLSSLSLTITAQNGDTSVDDNNGAITYKPNAGYSGSDSFVYTVSDIAGMSSNEATVDITVNAAAVTPPAVVIPETKTSSSGGGFGYWAILVLAASYANRSMNS